MCICADTLAHDPIPLRMIRKKEIQLWHRPEVCELRGKFTLRAYAWLGLYAGTALWINLCYVFAYDTPTVWYVHTRKLCSTQWLGSQHCLNAVDPCCMLYALRCNISVGTYATPTRGHDLWPASDAVVTTLWITACRRHPINGSVFE